MGRVRGASWADGRTKSGFGYSIIRFEKNTRILKKFINAV